METERRRGGERDREIGGEGEHACALMAVALNPSCWRVPQSTPWLCVGRCIAKQQTGLRGSMVRCDVSQSPCEVGVWSVGWVVRALGWVGLGWLD